MTEEKWRGYEWIWTTHADEFALLQFESKGKQVTIIRHTTSSQVSNFIIEDDEVYKAVKKKMLEEGVRVVSEDPVQHLRRKQSEQMR